MTTQQSCSPVMTNRDYPYEVKGRPEGRAQEHWDRAAQDLDREDSDIQRNASAGKKPARPSELR
jgi:Protein of unknown function (DUF2934)